MTPDMLLELLPQVINISHKAGRVVLDFHTSKQYETTEKQDLTPVTCADLSSHDVLYAGLTKLTPELRVISEEADSIAFNLRKNWDTYWLVDPLDGTHEFIEHGDDFAVVISLIHNNTPVLGVVYEPVLDTTYYAVKDNGAWKKVKEEEPIALRTNRSNSTHLNFVISSRQSIDKISPYLAPGWTVSTITKGSASLKCCLVAEGTADCYARFGPTGEWDTAAGQIIIQEAGGDIVCTELKSLTYNQTAHLNNPYFLAIGNLDLPWSSFNLPKKQFPKIKLNVDELVEEFIAIK